MTSSPLLLLALAACSPPNGPPIARTCHGDTELCYRPLNEVAILKTHNSHASEARGYSPLAMNQFEAIPTQLRDGVRSLNVDVYEEDGVLVACHGFCGLGSQPLDDVLTEVEDFLTEFPTEPVLIDFQDEAPPGAIAAALADHPVSALAHARQPGDPWATLLDLVDAGTPLLVFGERQDGDPPWFLNLSDHTYRTGWEYLTPEELDCAPADPVVAGGLYEIVHVLTNPLANPDNAEAINHEPVIGEHLSRCNAEVAFVNQISVDYYSIGDGLDAVAAANGLR